MMHDYGKITFPEDEDEKQKGKNENEEKTVYTTLGTADLDCDVTYKDPQKNRDPFQNDTFEEKDSQEDLLEPFPTRIHDNVDHDRRPAEADIDSDEDEALRPGDHVYVWKAAGFLKMKTFQKHGIVVSVDPDDESNVAIATFYHRNNRHDDEGGNFFGRRKEKNDGQEEDDGDESLLHSKDNAGNTGHAPPSSSPNTKDAQGRNEKKLTNTVRTESLSTFVSDSKGKIRKVKYNQGLAKRILRRGGTVSSCKADEQGLILARVKYLLGTPDAMPEFQMLSANGECAAVWCMIGRWCTLQGSSILHILFVGQAGGAVAGGAIASNVMLWAPMPGFWGSIGYIWYVPATVAFPILVPILVGFGLASLVPLEVLRRNRKKWAELSSELNRAFWANTDDDIRQFYFASTASADDDWTGKFFGTSEEEENKGQYMPLGGSGADDDDSDEDEDEFSKRVSAEYGKGTPGYKSEEEFQSQWKNETTKEKWQNMNNKMSQMFGRKEAAKVTAVDNKSKGDDIVPLKDDDGNCREVL